jgi:hypothetical protein
VDNEYIQELFDQAAKGEISYLELQDYLDDARFDGDIIDFLWPERAGRTRSG